MLAALPESTFCFATDDREGYARLARSHTPVAFVAAVAVVEYCAGWDELNPIVIAAGPDELAASVKLTTDQYLVPYESLGVNCLLTNAAQQAVEAERPRLIVVWAVLPVACGRALSPEDQSRLLDAGDGPERLWSAWAIALRLGRDALPLLRSTEGSDIPDGLRRQLLVVLAGMGERGLLRAIAESEQSPSVQATASMLYLRTAPSPSNSETISFALRQLRTAPAEVRRAVLGEQELGQASIPTRELFPTPTDPDVAVRIACATCILKDASSETYPDSVRALVAAFADECESDVRREFLAKLPRSAVPAVLDAVRGDASRVLEVLDTAVEHFGVLGWGDVRSIAPSATLEVTRRSSRREYGQSFLNRPGGFATRSEQPHTPLPV